MSTLISGCSVNKNAPAVITTETAPKDSIKINSVKNSGIYTVSLVNATIAPLEDPERAQQGDFKLTFTFKITNNNNQVANPIWHCQFITDSVSNYGVDLLTDQKSLSIQPNQSTTVQANFIANTSDKTRELTIFDNRNVMITNFKF
mgnify:FL=1